jgi:TIR domain
MRGSLQHGLGGTLARHKLHGRKAEIDSGVWDLFISHASEDKDDVARPLAEVLVRHGYSVWYDEFTLVVGDSLRRSIDRGIAQSKYGLVILSPYFFQKEWPQLELDGLFSTEAATGKAILPVWHKVSFNEVRRYSPMLAQKFALRTEQGLDTVVEGILKVFAPEDVQGLGPTLLSIETPTEVEYSQEGNRFRGWSEVRFRLAFQHSARFEWDFSFPHSTSYVFSLDGKVLVKDRFGLLWNDLTHTFTLEGVSCTFKLKSRFGDGTGSLLVGETWLWSS